MLIIAALSIEVAPLLSAFSTQKVKAYSRTCGLYAGGGHDFLIAGVGPMMTQRTLTAYFSDHATDHIVNIGSAGLLNNDLKPEQPYYISKALSLSSAAYDLSLPEGAKGQICLSVDKPITDPAMRDTYAVLYQASLVDMECYTIAEYAAEKNIKFTSLKVATDRADEQTDSDFRASIERCSQILLQEVQKIR